MRLTIQPDGNVRTLWTEEIPLSSLGKIVDVRRVSNIEFDLETFNWQVMDLTGKVLYTNPSRNECVAWEHANIAP